MEYNWWIWYICKESYKEKWEKLWILFMMYREINRYMKDLVDFYSVLYNEPIISNKFMNTVRDIRNASAHSNCLINKLFEELPATQQPDAEIKDDWSYDKTGRLYFFGV